MFAEGRDIDESFAGLSVFICTLPFIHVLFDELFFFAFIFFIFIFIVIRFLFIVVRIRVVYVLLKFIQLFRSRFFIKIKVFGIIIETKRLLKGDLSFKLFLCWLLFIKFRTVLTFCIMNIKNLQSIDYLFICIVLAFLIRLFGGNNVNQGDKSLVFFKSHQTKYQFSLFDVFSHLFLTS